MILDHTGTYVVAVLAGRPNDATWEDDVNKALQDEFEKARAEFHFSQEPNRRGDDVEAVSVGISFGGGQQVSNLFRVVLRIYTVARPAVETRDSLPCGPPGHVVHVSLLAATWQPRADQPIQRARCPKAARASGYEAHCQLRKWYAPSPRISLAVAYPASLSCAAEVPAAALQAL